MSSVTIKGLQALQARNLRMTAALQPKGGLGRAIQFVTIEVFRYLVSITHVDTGAYRAADRMEVKESRGRIFVAPGARNPRSGQLVTDYAPEEEARGGAHAAYARAERDMGPQALDRGVQFVQKELGL